MKTRNFKRYTLEEYVAYLRSFVGRVNFPEVHVHATWKPTVADFHKRGATYLLNAMYRAHLQRGFSDIAQHATLDPDGYVWEGRSPLLMPASATGYNGISGAHPFMFEMIGNFDAGCERLEGAQLRTAVGLTHALVDMFGSRIVFHREINDTGKTCPGSGIDKAEFVALVNSWGAPEKEAEELEKISVYVDGKRVADGLFDAKAGVTYLPARSVVESYGSAIKWDGKNKRVDITKK